MNQLTPYNPTGGPLSTDIVAQHAAADSLINRLLVTPVHAPRVRSEIQADLRILASAAGDVHFYSFPVKNHKTNKTTEVHGPSIQLAEDVLAACGNCGVVTTHIELADAWIITATFIDREKGSVLSRQFRQRRGQVSMRGDDERAQDIAFQIGQSKAIRNVIVRGLRQYVDYAYEFARNSLLEKFAKNVDAGLEHVRKWMDGAQIDRVKMARHIGRAEKDWGAEELVTVLGICKAIHERLTTEAEVYGEMQITTTPPKAPPAPFKKLDPNKYADDGAPPNDGDDRAAMPDRVPDQQPSDQAERDAALNPDADPKSKPFPGDLP